MSVCLIDRANRSTRVRQRDSSVMPVTPRNLLNNLV
jgi:hypothetical protein